MQEEVATEGHLQELRVIGEIHIMGKCHASKVDAVMRCLKCNCTQLPQK